MFRKITIAVLLCFGLYILVSEPRNTTNTFLFLIWADLLVRLGTDATGSDAGGAGGRNRRFRRPKLKMGNQGASDRTGGK